MPYSFNPFTGTLDVVPAVSTLGAVPVGSQTSSSVVTSASNVFVTVFTTAVTLTAASSPIYAIATADIKATTAACVMQGKIVINGVSGQVQQLSLLNVTDHYTQAVEMLSANLGPGTYTVLYQINRLSGTGTVNFFQGTLAAIGMQGGQSAGITQLTGALQAGPGSGSQVLSGILPLANGGTNSNLVAANGAIPYSTGSAIALLAPGIAGDILRSGGAGAPTWTTEIFPPSTIINQILYSSAANVVTGLATANTGVLVTSSTGVPSILSGAVANRLLRTNGTTISFAQVALATDVSGTLPVTNGGTGLTASFASGRVMFSNGSTNAADPLFTYNTATNQFTVGSGAGTGKISSIVLTTDPTPTLIAGNFYSRGTNVCIQAQNEGTVPGLSLINGGSAVGALINAQYSRGTLVARTQSLSGDVLFSLITNGYTGSAFTAGSSGSIQVLASENTTASAQGGELVLGATPNTTTASVERLRIKQSGETTLVNSHLKSTQTSAPTIAVGPSAGTGSLASIASATDVAGVVSITTGTLGISTGSYATITFNKAYLVAPIVLLTPANGTISTSVYVTSTTTTFDVNFALAGGVSSTYLLNYHVIETQ